MSDKRIRIAVNVFVIKEGNILLGRRINVSGHNTWGLPGGHVEFGEDLDKAAARELEEETGLVADKLKFLHVVNEPREDTHYIHVNFLAEKWHGNPENKEPEKCAELRWFPLDELPADMFFAQTPFFPALTNKQVYVEARIEPGGQTVMEHE